MMLLKNLIKNISKDNKKIIISGLASDSREVKKNYIYFAIKGTKFNGENFIKEAINRGASLIVCSKKCKFKSKNIFVIRTHDVRNLINYHLYFIKLSLEILLRTGTNGKHQLLIYFFNYLKLIIYLLLQLVH